MSPELEIVLRYIQSLQQQANMAIPKNVRDAVRVLLRDFNEEVDEDDFFFTDWATVGGKWRVTHDQYQELHKEVYQHSRKIMAIKLLRQWTGCGLKESKDAIEAEFPFNRR